MRITIRKRIKSKIRIRSRTREEDSSTCLRKSLETAHGSAQECAAALDILVAKGKLTPC